MHHTEIKHIDAILAAPLDFDYRGVEYGNKDYLITLFIDDNNGHHDHFTTILRELNTNVFLIDVGKTKGWYFDKVSHDLVDQVIDQILNTRHRVITVKRTEDDECLNNYLRNCTSKLIGAMIETVASGLKDVGFDYEVAVWPEFEEKPEWGLNVTTSWEPQKREDHD